MFDFANTFSQGILANRLGSVPQLSNVGRNNTGGNPLGLQQPTDVNGLDSRFTGFKQQNVAPSIQAVTAPTAPQIITQPSVGGQFGDGQSPNFKGNVNFTAPPAVPQVNGFTPAGVGNGVDPSLYQNAFDQGQASIGSQAAFAPDSVLGRILGNDKQVGLGQLGFQGASALASIYFGSQAVGQARDQLDFNRDTTNRNLANRSTLVNSQIRDQYRRGLQDRTGETVTNDDPRVVEYVRQNGVDGSAL